MNMAGVSLLGWVHTLACTLALLVGAFVLFGPKGTTRHKRLGRIYFYTMLVACVSILGVYHFDMVFSRPMKIGPGLFGLFHWEDVATLAVLLLGFYAASRQRYAVWAYVHPFSMLFTYYMLVGGLINELFVRIPFLNALAMSQVPHGARTFAGSPAVGLTQFAAMLYFIGLLIYFMVRVAMLRHRARLAAA